jgi:ABC-type multidrug transport system fused ATPase/permease subunit
MRLDNSDIRLLIVDEPTSALDPVAEDSLFTRLLQRREGKTVIFVTHRFGSLVKHADLILYVSLQIGKVIFLKYPLYRCLKEGKIVERGTHDTLMRVNGEYAKLYQPQAAYHRSCEVSDSHLSK